MTTSISMPEVLYFFKLLFCMGILNFLTSIEYMKVSDFCVQNKYQYKRTLKFIAFKF